MSPFENLIQNFPEKKQAFINIQNVICSHISNHYLTLLSIPQILKTCYICKPKNRNPDITVTTHYCYKLEIIVLLNFLNFHFMSTSQLALVTSGWNSRFCNGTLSREVPGHFCYCSPLGQSSAPDSLSGKSWGCYNYYKTKAGYLRHSKAKNFKTTIAK